MQSLRRPVGVLATSGLLALLGAQEPVPLLEGLGDHHYEVTTSAPLAQEYFDQGLRLYYAFNHQEAIRSFRQAQQLDPTCAMCYWGEALAYGPNINLPMDRMAGLAAWSALQKAIQAKSFASEKERALIDALARRYVANPPEDRAHLDEAYADAMGELARRWPNDIEIGTLAAEARMDLRPWDYWTPAGEPQPGMEMAFVWLERAIEVDPTHPGACHFYIHAMEKLHPDRAVPCAERLADLMPAAGHLVHMPGHIYIRVGRYRDAVEANRHAVHADESYIRDRRPEVGMYTAGYYPHNYDFLAFAAMMIGLEEESIGAAEKVVSLIPEEQFSTLSFLQHWSMRPVLMKVRFERWDDLLAVPQPPEDRPHARAIWHYGRGRAWIAKGDLAAAADELGRLRRIAERPELETLAMEFNTSADLLRIAERVLTGRLEAAHGRYRKAVEALREAVEAEDGLTYGEPPEWSVPTRLDLGDVLLQAGERAEAERAFRASLEQFPRNRWALEGLATALHEQGRHAEAGVVEAEVRTVDAEIAAAAHH